VDRNGLHVIVPILAFIGWARSMAFLGDNGTFALLATIAAGDPLRRRLTTEAGFRRFHSAVPVIRPWLAAGEPISPIRVMARLENSYRRLADGDGPVAGGMVLLGDGIRQTQNADKLEQFFSTGTERAFEITRGHGHSGLYSFPVVLVTLRGSHVARKTSEITLVETGKNDWVVDKLP